MLSCRSRAETYLSTFPTFGEFVVHLAKILVHPGAIAEVIGCILPLNPSVDYGRVFEVRFLAVHVDRVNSKPVDAFAQPEFHGGLVDTGASFGILPVEIGLLWTEQMEIVLLSVFIPFPHTAAKVASPVVWRSTIAGNIIFRWSPYVPVTFWVVPGRPRFLKPSMKMRSVIDNKIQNYPYATLMTSFNEVVHIIDSAIWRVHGLIIRDVVTHIILGTIVHWTYPDGIDSQRLDIVELADYSGQITNAIAVGVLEAGGIDLVNCGFLPPSLCDRHDGNAQKQVGSERGRRST